MAVCGDLIFSLTLALVFATLPALTRSSPIGHDRCERVRLAHQSFLNRPASQHHHSRGIIANICPQGSSSCCAGLELAIESKTREHFAGQLRSHLESFRLNFEQRDSRIRAQLASIFNETARRVNEKYSAQIAHANLELMKSVSKNVFRAHQTGSIDMHVDNLLQAIVVSEFKSHSPAISSDYISCLSSVNFVDFFGGIRSKLARSMHNAIETSRLILQSFHLASKLLERSEQVRLDEKCVRQLAGSFHCGACLLEHHRSNSATRPCRSTCRSVVSSCVASSELAPISQAWKDLAQSLGKLVDSVVAQRNPETIFAAYPSLLSEALELARSKNEISKKARVSCGPLDRSHQNVDKESSSSSYIKEQSQPKFYSESLFVSFGSMAHLWNHNKDLFDKFQNKFCGNYPESGCQDSRPSAHIPVAQPLVNNTAASSDDFFDSLRHYHSAVNTIQSNRLKLSNSTVYTVEEESSYNSNSADSLHDGSGSGDGDDTEPGDEYEEDLSGDGPLDTSTSTISSTSSTSNGFDFNEPFPPSPEKEGTGSGSASSLLSNCILPWVSFGAVLLFRLRHY